jgi:SAM-dependent methyltransferase
MAGFDDPAFYGDRWAAVYDEHHAHVDPAPAVEFLAGLAGDGRVLELAIGTGRVALPLAARGIAVEGIDASAAMVERLRAKPGGELIPVTIGDMAQLPAGGWSSATPAGTGGRSPRPATATFPSTSEPGPAAGAQRSLHHLERLGDG